MEGLPCLRAFGDPRGAYVAVAVSVRDTSRHLPNLRIIGSDGT